MSYPVYCRILDIAIERRNGDILRWLNDRQDAHPNTRGMYDIMASDDVELVKHIWPKHMDYVAYELNHRCLYNHYKLPVELINWIVEQPEFKECRETKYIRMRHAELKDPTTKTYRITYGQEQPDTARDE